MIQHPKWTNQINILMSVVYFGRGFIISFCTFLVDFPHCSQIISQFWGTSEIDLMCIVFNFVHLSNVILFSSDPVRKQYKHSF